MKKLIFFFFYAVQAWLKIRPTGNACIGYGTKINGLFLKNGYGTTKLKTAGSLIRMFKIS